ncbi:putative transposase [Bifidobacterium cuniculi]|uniref:Putative transposase n=1 Tax=Bifidobacterium cuniculi TaxID=1688 RepID=A0A087AT64_9BIFI|nr:putative transposase [Bifidobacterium cuniculi]
MARLAPPDPVVRDGDGGLLKALRERWPDTPVQRCLFHVCLAITKTTGTKPSTDICQQLRDLAVQISEVHDDESAIRWLDGRQDWCHRWQEYLDETVTDAKGRKRPALPRIVAVRRMADRLIASGTLFAFLDQEGAPATNNRIESANGRIRQMPRDHRGMSKARMVKAICWWCHQHGEHPESDAWLAAHALTEQQVDDWYRDAWQHRPQDLRDPDSLPLRYGIGIDWNAFHDH